MMEKVNRPYRKKKPLLSTLQKERMIRGGFMIYISWIGISHVSDISLLTEMSFIVGLFFGCYDIFRGLFGGDT